MTAKEFWEDDPQLFVSYRISFINKKERELQETDYKCWLEGLYNHHGNSIILARLQQFIVKIFSKSSQKQIKPYPSYPYFQEKEMEKMKKIKQKQKYQKYQQDWVYLGTMKKRYLEKLKKEQERKESEKIG